MMNMEEPNFSYKDEIDLLKKCMLWILYHNNNEPMGEDELKTRAQELAERIRNR